MTSTESAVQKDGECAGKLKREREEERSNKTREALTGVHTIVVHNAGALESSSAKLSRPKCVTGLLEIALGALSGI